MEEMLLGVTDRTTLVFIPDPASTDGSGKTGLVAANLTVSYSRVETDNDVTVTDVTSSLNNLSTLTDAHNDWGLLEVSNTLAPGLYRLDMADAVFASGAWMATVYVMITTSAAAATPKAYRLVAVNALDAVRHGLTALPNAAAEASGGLATLSAAQASNGTVPANVHRWLTATPNALISGRNDVSIGNVQSGVNGLERSGTAQSVGATSIVIDAGATHADNVLIGNTVKLTNGTHAGVTGIVTANVGATDTLTIGGGWSGGVTPTGTPTFELYSSAAGSAPSDSAGVTTLLSRLTPTRAGYLDNLSAGAVALEASLQALITTIGASAAGVATAVWGAATRLLTAGTNIVLAKGVGVTGFNDLSAAQVNTEADTALSDVGLTTTITERIDAAVSTRATPAQVATELGTYDGPTNAELTTALGTADDAVLAAIAALENLSAAQAQTAAAAALTAYDPPTNTEMEARTLTAALIAKLTAHLGGLATGVVGSGSTTTAVVFNAATGINAGAPSATNDFYNGRVIIFLTGTLALQATSISDYVGSTVTATVVALTSAPTAGDTFILV